MASPWRNFKNISSRPLFTIVFRPEMLKISPIFHFDRGNNGRICHILCVKNWLLYLFKSYVTMHSNVDFPDYVSLSRQLVKFLIALFRLSAWPLVWIFLGYFRTEIRSLHTIFDVFPGFSKVFVIWRCWDLRSKGHLNSLYSTIFSQ